MKRNKHDIMKQIEDLEEYLACPDKYEGTYGWYFSDMHNRWILNDLYKELYDESDSKNPIDFKKDKGRNRRRNLKKEKRLRIIEQNYWTSKGKGSRFNFYKKVSNKKIRQTMNIPLTGNGYRKVFDYQWMVW